MDGCLEQTKVQHMQEYIDQLKKENRYLKGLLDRAGISYNQTLSANHPPGEQAQKEAFASNQGARIQLVEITDELANRFFFRGGKARSRIKSSKAGSSKVRSA